MNQREINKQFFSAFNIYHFEEGEFNRDAFEQKMEEQRKIITNQLSEIKEYLAGAESQINELQQSDVTVKLMNSYQQLIQIFSDLEIEINKVWS
mgnify:CR=1 FL=1